MKPLSETTLELIARLHKRGGILHRMRDRSRWIDAVSAIGESGEIAAVPYLAAMLAQGGLVAATAAIAIGRLLSMAKGEHILSLENRIRNVYLWHDVDDWSRMRPRDIDKISVSDANLGHVLGVMSCHPNGFVREEAVSRLCDVHNGSEIAYLLIRLNDWVAPVREVAGRAVRWRLANEQFAGFEKFIELVFRLIECGRRDGGEVVDKVLQELVKHSGLLSIAAVLENESRVVRRKAYQLSLTTEGADKPLIVKLALQNDDAVLRLWSARDAREFLDDEALKCALEALQRDRFFALRREALSVTMQRFASRSEQTLTSALLDRHRSVREFARFHLRKRQAHRGFADFYRNAVSSSAELASAIAGLGETGDAVDAASIRPYLQNDDARVRQSAVWSLGHLAQDNEADVFVQMIGDASSKVAYAACRALEPRMHSVPLQQLLEVFRRESRRRVLKAIVDLFSAAGSWTGVPCLLEAAFHRDCYVAELARQRILSRRNRVFVTPKKDVRESIDDALQDNLHRLPSAFVESFSDWLAALP